MEFKVFGVVFSVSKEGDEQHNPSNKATMRFIRQIQKKVYPSYSGMKIPLIKEFRDLCRKNHGVTCTLRYAKDTIEDNFNFEEPSWRGE